MTKSYDSYAATGYGGGSQRPQRSQPQEPRVPVEGDGQTCRIEWQSSNGHQGHGSFMDRDAAISNAQAAQRSFPDKRHKVKCPDAPTS